MSSSVEQYADTFYCIVADGNSTELGSFTCDSDGRLKLAHVRLYIKNASSYSHTAKLVIAGKVSGTALEESSEITLSNAVTGQTTTDHLVNLTFEFDGKYVLKADESYYMRLELTGYTRAERPLENTQYLAVVSNWHEPIGGSNSAGVKIVIGVER